jgi:hypothetical protein
LTRGRARRVCAETGIIVTATIASSAIKLRARCAKFLFVFIINLSEKRPSACAVEILLALAIQPSLITLAMSVPLPPRFVARGKTAKTAAFSPCEQTPASDSEGCFNEVREGACILHHIV